MEQSVASLELVRPWRTATLVATAVAALELVLLLVLGVALLGNPIAEQVQAEAKQARALPPLKPKANGKPSLARNETAVMILNGNGVSGAAGRAAGQVRGIGYTIGAVGNAPRSDHTRSVVMYREGYRPEAARLARDLRVKIVAPLDGLRVDELLGAHVVYVVAD